MAPIRAVITYVSTASSRLVFVVFFSYAASDRLVWIVMYGYVACLYIRLLLSLCFFVSTQINTNGPNNIHTYMILFYCIPIPIPMPMPNYQDCGNRTGTDLSLESQSDHPLSYSEWRCPLAYGPSSRTQYCGPNSARTLRDDCARNGRIIDCG